MTCSKNFKEDAMLKSKLTFIFCLFLIGFYCSCTPPEGKNAGIKESGEYTDLLSIFKEFREFQKPEIINGLPDYSAAAMESQSHRLQEFQEQ